jgi:hypothetical protein
MNNPFDYESPLESVRQKADDWANATETLMEVKLASHRVSGALANSLAHRIKQFPRAEMAVRITFKFVRYGAWLEKGARKGYGGTQGSEWGNYKTGITKRTNPNSLGKMGTGKSPAVPFSQVSVDAQLPVLAEIVGIGYDEDIVKTFGTVGLKRI